MDEAAADVLAKGARAGGEVALTHAKQYCPVDNGTLRNSLKLSDEKN